MANYDHFFFGVVIREVGTIWAFLGKKINRSLCGVTWNINLTIFIIRMNKESQIIKKDIGKR